MEREAVLDGIRRVALELGTNSLGRKVFLQKPGESASALRRQFRSWREAVTEAGLVPAPRIQFTDDDHFREMAATFMRCGGVCAMGQFCFSSRRGLSNYRRRFGGWRSILAALQSWLEHTGEPFPYREQLAAAVANEIHGAPTRPRGWDPAAWRGHRAPLRTGPPAAIPWLPIRARQRAVRHRRLRRRLLRPRVRHRIDPARLPRLRRPPSPPGQ